ncbi:hypothetical protein THAOC_06325 [Thalassiosira oceanica]|uniref:Uncharacterized protein n=1 Tax=Thalassiosira oceanica TaxID=159749 RepID=K0TF72_THAOC|nr:hypothetical protein THAOC_06325 [Thalassiosira oceanica]|eukprot:EJK72171.1 hypothetical protein THAOC_06325 [Thalassiosira oceanica]
MTVSSDKPKVVYGEDVFPTDADKYLTVDSNEKLVKTSNYWSMVAGEAHLCQYKELVPCMYQLQIQLLEEQAGDAIVLVGCEFDGGITMYPYHEKVQPHYDYFASTIKAKGDLELIRFVLRGYDTSAAGQEQKHSRDA